MSDEADLIVLGGGPGGYVCAERAGQAGLSAVVIEKEALGGICLNWGCIPTKTLLACSKLYYQATHGEAFGVQADAVRFDLTKAMARKDQVQQRLRAGVAGLMKRHKVRVVEGTGRLVDGRSVAVGDEVIRGKHIVVATGSRPARPPIPGADADHVLDSTGILQITELPRRLVVIGGGVIGIEFACFFAQVGVDVTVVEMLPAIGGPIDADLAKVLTASMREKGITIHTAARVSAIEAEQVVFTDADGTDQRAPADLVLMATGRQPNVEDIGLEAAGVDCDRRGIRVDERCRTNVPTVSAIGDCNGRILLAHVASRQGEVVVNNLLGRADHMREHAIPGVIYTSPEVAFCGLSEAQARERGRAVKVASWPFAANGRFLAEQEGQGLAKLVVDADTGAVLGVHLIGNSCSEMIHAAAIAIEHECRAEDLKEVVFPHPTISEAQRDALFQLAE